jgi:hypothetical protein
LPLNNHLNSADVCEYACWALVNIVRNSKENIELLIHLDGGAAGIKARRKWTDNEEVQKQVRNDISQRGGKLWTMRTSNGSILLALHVQTFFFYLR